MARRRRSDYELESLANEVESWNSIYRRSPGEYYMKYVLTRCPTADFAALESGLTKYNIVIPPETGYLRRLADELELRTPKVFNPQDPNHTSSQMFLRHAGVWNMWWPDRAVHAAVRLQENDELRPILNSMIVASIHRQDIKRILAGKGQYVDDPALDQYEHFFWNLKILTLEEREALYQDRQVPRAVRTAATHGPGYAGRVCTLLSLGVPVDRANKRAMWEQREVEGFVIGSRAGTYGTPLQQAQALMYATEAMYKSHRALEELREQEQEGQGGVHTGAFTLMREQREVFTVQQLKAPNVNLPRLPGRAGLQVIDGDKGKKEEHHGSG